ncbi:MAG: aminoacyl-tRNA hydrolase [Verrucomicrobiota bacterium]
MTAPGLFPLVVGLGNPGRAYQKTRHNVGFEVLDLLASQGNLSWKKARFAKAVTCRINNGTWLVKPTTYMNLSGDAVRQSLKWFRLKPEQMIVVVDDIHLPLGHLRLRAKGSSGGHNGLRSIASAVQTEHYPRLRCGVGSPKGERELKTHVLGKFDKNEQAMIQQALEKAVQVLDICQQTGLDAAMNQANTNL